MKLHLNNEINETLWNQRDIPVIRSQSHSHHTVTSELCKQSVKDLTGDLISNINLNHLVHAQQLSGFFFSAKVSYGLLCLLTEKHWCCSRPQGDIPPSFECHCFGSCYNLAPGSCEAEAAYGTSSLRSPRTGTRWPQFQDITTWEKT